GIQLARRPRRPAGHRRRRTHHLAAVPLRPEPGLATALSALATGTHQRRPADRHRRRPGHPRRGQPEPDETDQSRWVTTAKLVVTVGSRQRTGWSVGWG